MPKIVTEQQPDGRWKATDGNDFAIMDTEDQAIQVLERHLRVVDSVRFCQYCGQHWNYCICAAMAD